MTATRAAQKTRTERKTLRRYKNLVSEFETLAHNGAPPIATGQTLAKLRRHPLSSLKSRGSLDVWELTAANGILEGYHISLGNRFQPDPDLGIVPGPARPDSADQAAAGRIDAAGRYAEWRADLARTDALGVAVAVLFDEVPVGDIDRTRRQRNGTALGHLRIALRHFAALQGNTPRGVQWRYKRSAPNAS